MRIPFNKPYMTGRELHYISQAHAKGHLAGDGDFSRRCHQWLEERIGCPQALLTHSCTAALEMSAILADIRPGDEVIMPSFTFVSTANAFVLRGAVPVFVEIRQDTLNLDEGRIEGAITKRTVAIVVVHYAGVACEMDRIRQIAERHNLLVIEDDAQGVGATYRDKPLGSFGDLAAVSFHETKNVISGEGGALLINASRFIERAEIVRQKGTNRNKFLRGEVDKYTWVDIGSSFLPSELIAAFLLAQLEESESITSKRMAIWNQYHTGFEALESQGFLRRPIVPEHCVHNAHMYYLLLPSRERRDAFIAYLAERKIHPVFHYIPLHSSPKGKEVGRAAHDLGWTSEVSDRLVRMPLWLGIEPHLEKVIELSKQALSVD